MSRPLAAAIFLALIGAAAAGPPHARRGCGDAYTVARGDTLYSIARRCRTSVAAIARASGLADPSRIAVGRRLRIPGGAAAEPAKPDEAGAPGAGAYRIQAADTLYSLARWSRVSLSALMAANPGIDPRRIEIGDPVRLPAGAADPARARERERGREAVSSPPRETRREAPEPTPPSAKPDDEDEPDPEGM